MLCNATAPTQISTLSLHDALPICREAAADLRATGLRLRLRAPREPRQRLHQARPVLEELFVAAGPEQGRVREDAVRDRKSTRLNSSHPSNSYAVFCLKKKNKNQHP